ncbi:hypothetical protein [Flavobacterium sp. XS2P14]|uniref:hypothetical protein n=1 Tax=Flavobacterium sp. XS2P14 TaxID=3401735 RepID=UPI003AADA7C6
MKSSFYKLLFLSTALVLLTEITNSLIGLKDLLYNSFNEQLTKKQIENAFEFQEKWHWVGYLIVPLVTIIKTSLIAGTLYMGTFFYSKIVVSFKKLWGIVLSAEFVFLLVPVFKMIWFYYFKTSYKLEDIQYFYPLSALNIVGLKGLEPWFIYPFQTLNLFEITYWLILAYHIGKATQTNMDDGLKIVLYSYGLALLLWVVTVMFITLNMA